MSDKDYIISEESAGEQFELFTDFYEIDLTDLDDGDGEVASQSVRNKFMRAVRGGRIEVREGENGVEVKQNLLRPIATLNEIVYGQLTGKARKALRKIKGHHAQMYTLLSVLSGEGTEIYDKMTGKDLSAAESVALLFLIA